MPGIVAIMRILVVASAYAPAVRAGGVARTLTNLVDELGRDDMTVDVVAPDRDLGDTAPFPGLSGRTVTRGSTKVHYLDMTSMSQVSSLLKRLRRVRYDLIMVNSVWHPQAALMANILVSLKVLRGPVLLLPHGELEEGCLAMKARKKRLAGYVYRGIYRHSVTIFGATSHMEAKNIAAWCRGMPVVTSLNNKPDAIEWGCPSSRSDKLQVLFLSRIHPKKGLLELLRGLVHVTGRIDLQIVGPLEVGAYWQECQAVMDHLPDNVTVTLAGLVQRDGLPELLHNSDCMVLLTVGENYGHVIAESLQAGCSVIATPTTPFTEVLAAGGGQIVQDRDDYVEVSRVLDRWAAKTPEELLQERHKARAAFEEFANQAGPNIVQLALERLGK